jgi:serine/threonine-protein kinase
VALFADRYEIGPVIGRGGMAEVRAGRDTRLDRPVAVKIMRSELSYQRLVRDRFESEARLAARLNHPSVVAVFDSGEAAGAPYIVMERLPGETLRDRLAKGPMSEAEVRQLAVEVLAALETAHAAGVLHRDIKPANILVSGGGHWKVTDFGIAKALEVSSGDATATGLVLGTPAYLAPERLVGEPATVASDVYSLGVVLYEALAGRRPFGTGSGDAWPGVLAGAPLVPLSKARPGIDPVLAAAVARTLAADPTARFWSAAEMAAALSRAAPVDAVPVDAVPVDAVRVDTVPVDTGATAVMGAGPATEVMPPAYASRAAALGAGGSSGRRPRARLMTGIAAMAIAAAVVLAGVAAAHDPHSSAKSTTTVATTTTTLAPTTTTSSTTTPVPATPAPRHGGDESGPAPPGKHHDG